MQRQVSQSAIDHRAAGALLTGFVPIVGDGLSNFMRGLMLGFASPLLFLGPLPKLEVEEADDIALAWRDVGRALEDAMAYHGTRLNGRDR